MNIVQGKNQRFSTLLLLLPLVVSCTGAPAIKSATVYTPMISDETDVARLISTDNESLAELSNGRIKMLVEGGSSFIQMKLILPRGEELFIDEPFAELIEAVSHEQLDRRHVAWEFDKFTYVSMNQQGIEELDEFIDQIIDTEIETEAGKLVGLEEFPFSSIYTSTIFIENDLFVQFKVKLPTFKNGSNEVIRFADVSFSRETKSSIYWKRLNPSEQREVANSIAWGIGTVLSCLYTFGVVCPGPPPTY